MFPLVLLTYNSWGLSLEIPALACFWAYLVAATRHYQFTPFMCCCMWQTGLCKNKAQGEYSVLSFAICGVASWIDSVLAQKAEGSLAFAVCRDGQCLDKGRSPWGTGADDTSRSLHSSKHTIVDRHSSLGEERGRCSLIFHSAGGGVKQIIQGKMFFLPFLSFPLFSSPSFGGFKCTCPVLHICQALKILLSQSHLWPVNSWGKACEFYVGVGLEGSRFGWQEATDKQDCHSPVITALLITDKLQVSSHHCEHTVMNAHGS